MKCNRHSSLSEPRLNTVRTTAVSYAVFSAARFSIALRSYFFGYWSSQNPI